MEGNLGGEYTFSQCPTGTFAYVIQAGDSYFLLARRFGTTMDALMAVNPNVNPDNLMVGQQICIPRYPPCPNGSLYTLREGDTLFLIAQRYGISLSDLLAANPSIDPMFLFAGNIICVPLAAPLPCPSGSMPYLVQAGDTFYSISRKYNVSLDALLAANPHVDPDYLLVGQQICIPMKKKMPVAKSRR